MTQKLKLMNQLGDLSRRRPPVPDRSPAPDSVNVVVPDELIFQWFSYQRVPLREAEIKIKIEFLEKVTHYLFLTTLKISEYPLQFQVCTDNR